MGKNNNAYSMPVRALADIEHEHYTVRGMLCTIYAQHRHLCVVCDGVMVTNASGSDMHPVINYWQGSEGYRLAHTRGAALRSMRDRIIREAIAREIDEHADYCRQLIDDGVLCPQTGREL